jgi:hypothetical protein
MAAVVFRAVRLNGADSARAAAMRFGEMLASMPAPASAPGNGWSLNDYARAFVMDYVSNGGSRAVPRWQVAEVDGRPVPVGEWVERLQAGELERLPAWVRRALDPLGLSEIVSPGPAPAPEVEVRDTLAELVRRTKRLAQVPGDQPDVRRAAAERVTESLETLGNASWGLGSSDGSRIPRYLSGMAVHYGLNGHLSGLRTESIEVSGARANLSNWASSLRRVEHSRTHPRRAVLPLWAVEFLNMLGFNWVRGPGGSGGQVYTAEEVLDAWRAIAPAGRRDPRLSAVPAPVQYGAPVEYGAAGSAGYEQAVSGGAGWGSGVGGSAVAVGQSGLPGVAGGSRDQGPAGGPYEVGDDELVELDRMAVEAPGGVPGSGVPAELYWGGAPALGGQPDSARLAIPAPGPYAGVDQQGAGVGWYGDVDQQYAGAGLYGAVDPQYYGAAGYRQRDGEWPGAGADEGESSGAGPSSSGGRGPQVYRADTSDGMLNGLNHILKNWQRNPPGLKAVVKLLKAAALWGQWPVLLRAPSEAVVSLRDVAGLQGQDDLSWLDAVVSGANWADDPRILRLTEGIVAGFKAAALNDAALGTEPTLTLTASLDHGAVALIVQMATQQLGRPIFLRFDGLPGSDIRICV